MTMMIVEVHGCYEQELTLWGAGRKLALLQTLMAMWSFHPHSSPVGTSLYYPFLLVGKLRHGGG